MSKIQRMKNVVQKLQIQVTIKMHTIFHAKECTLKLCDHRNIIYYIIK